MESEVLLGHVFGCTTPSSVFGVSGVPFECRPWAVTIACTIFFFVLQEVAHRTFTKDSTGKALSASDRLDAAIRFVALIHSLVVWVGIPGYFWPEESLLPQNVGGELVYNHYAYSSFSQHLYAFSTAYFIWDIFVSIRYQWGAMFIMHAFVSFGVFFLAQAPFLHLWGLYFQGVFELSTVFFHFRAILSLLKMESTLLFKAVQGIFALSFLLVRILFGFYSSWGMWRQLLALFNSDAVRVPLVIPFYLGANALIMVLQVIWCAEFIKVAIGAKTEESQMKKQE